jgi:hypothetical protein
MVTFAALPDSGRPSVWATTAVGTTQFAGISGPGRLCSVLLNWTSSRGTV